MFIEQLYYSSSKKPNKQGYTVHRITRNALDQETNETYDAIQRNFEDFLHVQKVWLRAHKYDKPKYRYLPSEMDLEKIKNGDIILKEKPNGKTNTEINSRQGTSNGLGR